MTAFGLLGGLLYDALGLESAQLAVAVVGLGGEPTGADRPDR